MKKISIIVLISMRGVVYIGHNRVRVNVRDKEVREHRNKREVFPIL